MCLDVRFTLRNSGWGYNENYVPGLWRFRVCYVVVVVVRWCRRREFEIFLLCPWAPARKIAAMAARPHRNRSRRRNGIGSQLPRCGAAGFGWKNWNSEGARQGEWRCLNAALIEECGVHFWHGPAISGASCSCMDPYQLVAAAVRVWGIGIWSRSSGKENEDMSNISWKMRSTCLYQSKSMNQWGVRVVHQSKSVELRVCVWILSS